jgi:hypothetical protein
MISNNTNDVQYLLILRSLSHSWKAEVEEETERRIRLSQSPSYDPYGCEKARGPWPPQQTVSVERMMGTLNIK